jgi:hypothetical protein
VIGLSNLSPDDRETVRVQVELGHASAKAVERIRVK